MTMEFDRLGPYRVLGVLGRGGMGTVYRGINDETKDEAAVKVLAPNLAADDSFRERFEAEIESLKKLHHPNIVELYGFGEEAGHLFYSMELIDGKSLQDELKQGRRYDWREVISLGIEVCSALKHAHDHGIIHRDIKPANLLVDESGTTKLFDFGIAKLFGSTAVTTNTVLGTADFMAPEQTEGKTSGPRTDLYSLGSVFYALLAGRPPFTGKTVVDVVHKLRFDDPLPLGRYNREVPAQLEKLIETLLSKNPYDRIPTALALANRLKAVESSYELNESSDTGDDVMLGFAGNDSDSNLERISDQPTVAITGRSSEPSDDLIAEKGRRKRSHFTSVDDSEEEPQKPTFDWSGIGKLVAMTTVLGLMALAFWLFLQPPTADTLYDDIMSRVDVEDPQTLIVVRPKLEQFQGLYSDDERYPEISGLIEDLSLYRLQRRLELNARRRESTAPASPVEQLYLEAVQLIPTDPDSAASHLQAIIDINDTQAEADAEMVEAARCIMLARKQLAKLKEEIEKSSESHTPFIIKRMAEARELEKSDAARARLIYSGILRLYEKRPWATAVVNESRQAIKRLNSVSARKPSDDESL